MAERRALGFWNRLAIVAGAVITISGPTWIIVSDNSEMTQRRENGYAWCMEQAAKGGSDLTGDFCQRTWFGEPVPYLGWEQWFQGVGFAALLCVIVYALIWSVVWVAKWVWRGRHARP